MANTGFKANEDAINRVGISFSNLINENDTIKTKANSIDASLVSDFYPGASGAIEGIVSSVNTLISDSNDLETSYTLAKNEIIELIRQHEELVDSKIEDKDDLANTKDTYFETDEETLGNMNAKLSFYFNYPNAAKEAVEISEDQLRSLFEKNGARAVDNNNRVYEFTIDGKTYNYDLSKHLITMPGERGSMYARFYATGDVDFNNIKSTISLMDGTGGCNKNTVDKNLDSGVNASNDSIIILPYGESIFNTPHLVAGATRTADFLGGGTSSTITNSIVGYSLGGMVAAKTVSSNKGLYKNLVFVNSGICQYDGLKNILPNPNDPATYEAFKDVQIIFFEGSGDKFNKSAGKTIDTFIANGVPKENIYVYTNDQWLTDNYTSTLGEDHVVSPPSDYPVGGKRGWHSHSYGFNMIKESGLVNYLSKAS